MANDSFFAKIQEELRANKFRARSQASRTWFQNRLKNISNVNRSALLRDSSLIIRKAPAIGSMMMYVYSAQGKDTLEYWDKFPLTICIQPEEEGFSGLNLHYCAPPLRALLLSRLYDITTNKRFDETTKIKASYEILKGSQKYRQFRPMWHRYRFDCVQTPYSIVPASDWEMAVFLPSEQFTGASKEKVWRDSQRMI